MADCAGKRNAVEVADTIAVGGWYIEGTSLSTH